MHQCQAGKTDDPIKELALHTLDYFRPYESPILNTSSLLVGGSLSKTTKETPTLKTTTTCL